MTAADSLATTVIELQRQKEALRGALREAMEAALNRRESDTADSELDNERPVVLLITLGEYRKWRRLICG